MYIPVIIRDLIDRLQLTPARFAIRMGKDTSDIYGWLSGRLLPNDRDLIVISFYLSDQQPERGKIFESIQKIRDYDSRRHL